MPMKQRPKSALGTSHTNDPADGEIWEVLTGPLFPEKPVRPLADIKGCRFGVPRPVSASPSSRSRPRYSGDGQSAVAGKASGKARARYDGSRPPPGCQGYDAD